MMFFKTQTNNLIDIRISGNVFRLYTQEARRKIQEYIQTNGNIENIIIKFVFDETVTCFKKEMVSVVNTKEINEELPAFIDDALFISVQTVQQMFSSSVSNPFYTPQNCKKNNESIAKLKIIPGKSIQLILDVSSVNNTTNVKPVLVHKFHIKKKENLEIEMQIDEFIYLVSKIRDTINCDNAIQFNLNEWMYMKDKYWNIIEDNNCRDLKYKPKTIFCPNASISFCINYETFTTLFLETAQKISDTIIKSSDALSGKLIIILTLDTIKLKIVPPEEVKIC